MTPVITGHAIWWKLMDGKCEFLSCERIARLFYFLPKSGKSWYCVEHYDLMVAHYKMIVSDGDGDSWDRDIVRLNGW
jgi:hypothetical protein